MMPLNNLKLNKIREEGSAKKGVMHYYIEVKQVLLQSFCQGVTFYLLLKTEGQPVRDHPVVSSLVEIKSLLDKMKELDENLPSNLEDIVNKHVNHAAVLNLGEETGAKEADSFKKAVITSTMSSVKHAMVVPGETPELAELNITSTKNIESQQKRQVISGDDGKYPNEMVLEKGEESMSCEFWQELELHLLVILKMRLVYFPVMVLLRPMGRAIRIQIWNITNKSAKLAATSNKYSRTHEVSSLPDTVDGKRLITHQMEKNRGLTHEAD